MWVLKPLSVKPLKALSKLKPRMSAYNLFLAVAAGKAGEIFNQNQTQSSTVIGNGGFSSQTISTTARKPNILAAAVEGFFKPMSQRLGQRADKSSQELSSRPNVAIVPAGKKVSIFLIHLLKFIANTLRL